MELIKTPLSNLTNDLLSINVVNMPKITHAFTRDSFPVPAGAIAYTGVVNDLIGAAHINSAEWALSDVGFSPPINAPTPVVYATQEPLIAGPQNTAKMVLLLGQFQPSAVPLLQIGNGNSIIAIDGSATPANSHVTKTGVSAAASAQTIVNSLQHAYAVVFGPGSNANYAADFYFCVHTGAFVTSSGAANIDWITAFDFNTHLAIGSFGSGSIKIRAILTFEFVAKPKASYIKALMRWLAVNSTNGLPLDSAGKRALPQLAKGWN